MAIVNKGYRYRMYPTPSQEVMFAKTFGCCRKVYNLMLAERNAYYKETGKTLKPTPAKYKEQYPYLKEVDSLALANEQLNLEDAFDDFFEQKKVGFPKFKSKHTDKDSYTTNLVNGNIKVGANAIKLPKIGYVKYERHRDVPFNYVLKGATITREKDGTYHISLKYEYEDMTVKQDVEHHIGLDYMSNGLFADSNGHEQQMPKFYRNSEKRLAKLQQKLSRKQGARKGEKPSNNFLKQKKKVAKLAKHVANQRNDYLQKLSTQMANQYELISIEDLNMQAMSRTLKLGKSTMDNGYGEFTRMLKYKQDDRGHRLIKVDKFYPSSQLCQCGYKNPITKDLSVTTITCPICGRTYDRNINAAINIDKEGYRLFEESLKAPVSVS